MGRAPSIKRQLLKKGKDAVLLAIEIYNKPNVEFRSGGYIVLMMIAWSALLYAVLSKRKINCFERTQNNRIVYVNDEPKVLSLNELVSKCFANSNDPIRLNLELFIPLRDKLEHRNYPQLDNEIFGECQALLMNFEDVYTEEFPKEPPLKQNLLYALQFSKMNPPEELEALKSKFSKDYLKLVTFIRDYRGRIPEEVWESQKFSIRLYLIPKVGNNIHSDDIAVEFIKYDPTKVEEVKKIKQLGVLIKEKTVEKLVPSQGIYHFKPKGIVDLVSSAIGKQFKIWMHTNAWKFFKARPSENSEGFQTKYCLFDTAHRDYVYSEKWVQMLKEKLSDPLIYEEVRKFGSKNSV